MLGKSRIRDEHSISFYTELRNSFTFFDPDPGSGINIPDPQRWCFTDLIKISGQLNTWIRIRIRKIS
jgi:hypothetical protein